MLSFGYTFFGIIIRFTTFMFKTHYHIIIFSFMVFFLLSAGNTACPQGNNEDAIQHITNILPSIVIIESTVPVLKMDGAPPKKRINPLLYLAKYKRYAELKRKGSGAIINELGLIVTNSHIVRKANHIKITLYDGSSLDAKLVRSFEKYDISFLQIELPHGIEPITLADSENVILGEPVYTIGSSLFLKNTFYQGKITGIGKYDGPPTNERFNIDLLKTDLNLYKGDSGAPLLNKNGKLLGLIFAGHKDKNYFSLAIPSNKIKYTLNMLLETV